MLCIITTIALHWQQKSVDCSQGAIDGGALYTQGLLPHSAVVGTNYLMIALQAKSTAIDTDGSKEYFVYKML